MSAEDHYDIILLLVIVVKGRGGIISAQRVWESSENGMSATEEYKIWTTPRRNMERGILALRMIDNNYDENNYNNDNTNNRNEFCLCVICFD